MTSASSTIPVAAPQYSERLMQWAIVCVAILMMIAAVVALGAQQPIIAAGITFTVPLAFMLWKWPNTLVYLVLFLTYINFPVVAMKYHGVPFIVCAAIPGLLLIPLARAAIIGREGIIITRAFPLVGIFLAIQAVGVCVARTPNIAFGEFMISLTEGLVFYFLVSNVVRTRDQLHKAVWALVAAGAFMGGICLFQQVTKTYDYEYGGFAQVQSEGFGLHEARGDVRQRRLSGPIGVENRFAQVMLMVVPLALFRCWSERSAPLRVVAVAATMLTFFGWGLAFSRGSAVGFVLMIGVMTAMGCIKSKQLVFVAIAVMILLLGLPQYRTRLAKIQLAAGLISQTANVSNKPDDAIKGRVTEMLAAVRVFADYPVTGVGPGMFKYMSHEYGKVGGLRALEGRREAHCLYLDVAAEHGLPGLLCFLAIPGITLLDLMRTRRRCLIAHRDPEIANLLTGFVLMITAYLTSGIFAHFSFIRYFWLMMALAGAASVVGARSLMKTEPSAGLIEC